MPAGLQIWSPDAIDPSEAVIDITNRCLNILGEIETGVWMAPNSWDKMPSELAGQGYNSDDIFSWRSIIVPEFAYGKPFYNISLNEYNYLNNAISTQNAAYQWLNSQGINAAECAIKEGIRYYSNGATMSFDAGPSDFPGPFRSFCEPDVVIEGTTLSYRYLSGWRDNVLGDYSWIFIGGHRIVYGVV
ncbi:MULTISPECIES: hypothetical protein [unclassified Brenneria]|uniref:hypothetical protein n=1 Tax=unclassified Brenneria TaxID=2634434 RepID=UPI0015559EC1|nr:hypothetical protein [Brenneria sp. hezel4-2-4]MEE3649451.1 hypothetical protein [Brenneria sp. HEZEL_4_2_4]NPC99406.1 hypothetical protein [Brenneria sp. hezel4-2-4]